VLLVAMLDMEIHVHLILGGALGLFLGLVTFLIAAMDNPFRGEVSVTPDPFRQVYESLMLPSDAVDRAMARLIALTGELGPPGSKAGKPLPAGTYQSAAGPQGPGDRQDPTRRSVLRGVVRPGHPLHCRLRADPRRLGQYHRRLCVRVSEAAGMSSGSAALQLTHLH